MLKLTRKLLRGIAKALARYVNSIEKLLAQEDASANHSLSDYSDERPPAHWLAKVRKGAPQLLDNRSGDDTKTVAYSSEIKSAPGFNPLVFSDTHEEPPAHWIRKVRHGAPHLLDEQPIYQKNIPNHFVTHDRKLPQLPSNQDRNAVDSNKEDITVKQSYPAQAKPGIELKLPYKKLSIRTSGSTWPGLFDAPVIKTHTTEIQHGKTRLKALAGQTKGYYKKADNPFSGDVPPSISEKAINKTESEQADQTKPSARRSKTESEISFSDRQFKVPRLSAILPGTSTQNTKYQQPFSSSHEQFTVTRRMQIKRDPYENSKTPQQVPNITADSHGFANKHAPSQHDFNETAVLNPDKTTHFSFSHKPGEQLNVNRQSTVKRSPETADSAAINVSSGSNYKRYIASIAKTVEPFEPDLPRWPNLPGEKERRLQDDQWPALPEEKLPEPDQMIQPAIHFTQLQETIRRRHHSELEQRGLFWNG